MQAREAIGSAFTKWKTFDGRASRSEYWWFVLFIVLGSIAAGLLDQILFGAHGARGDRTEPLGVLFSLIIFLPGLAVLVRRLHDIGKSGWFAALPAALGLLHLVSGGMVGTGAGAMQSHGIGPGMVLPAAFLVLGVTGALIAVFLSLIVVMLMLVWLTRPGEAGPNRYGPKPD